MPEEMGQKTGGPEDTLISLKTARWIEGAKHLKKNADMDGIKSLWREVV